MNYKSPKTVWTPKMDALLGAQSDRLVSEELGVKFCRVVARRNVLGIESSQPQARWSRDRIGMLGTMQDTRIAREMGVNAETVRRKRISLDIPRFYVDK